MGLVEQCLREVFETAVAGDPGFCITLEDVNDDGNWVQLTWDMLNFFYPPAEEPLQVLAHHGISLPAMVELSSWDPGLYATFEHGSEPDGELMAFVEAYLDRILGIGADEQSLIVARESL